MAQFTNQAFLSYGNLVASSNIAISEFIAVFSAKKSQSRGQLTYIISLLNSGNVAYNTLYLIDNFGTYTFNGMTLTPLSYIPDTIFIL